MLTLLIPRTSNGPRAIIDKLGEGLAMPREPIKAHIEKLTGPHLVLRVYSLIS